MKKKTYKHPVTHKEYVVASTGVNTQQGNTSHLLEFFPVSGGACVRFIRYSRGEYRKFICGQLVPVSINSYYPGFTARGLI